MAAKTNSKSVRDTLDERLKSDASILSSFSKVAAFAAAAASGEPLSLLADITKVSEAAGAALTGASEVARRLSQDGSESGSRLHSYDRFKALFYTTCARAYIEAIPSCLSDLKKVKDKNSPRKDSSKEIDALKARLETGVANLSDAEVTFLFGIEPLSGSVPLFTAYSAWLLTTLEHYGFDESQIRPLITKCEKEARERFRVFLSSTDPAAEWMRKYLAIYRDEHVVGLISNLQSVSETLKEWTAPGVELKRREREAWISYREMLRSLPDQKETMFNEKFGVRHVFVQPQATYQIAGAVGDAGQPQMAPDLGRLLGALISTRTTGDDLIILCGGPGSGKSTFCGVMASELRDVPRRVRASHAGAPD